MDKWVRGRDERCLGVSRRLRISDHVLFFGAVRWVVPSTRLRISQPAAHTCASDRRRGFIGIRVGIGE
ncbi:MAG: hypothetical protein V7640_2341 [Betaproteobacteria bacterium]|jgi:hypothetical protein